jgi:hypothetical protein
MSSFQPPLYSHEYPRLSIASAWIGVMLIGLTAVSRIIASERITTWTSPLLVIVPFMAIALTLASIIYVRYSALFNLKIAALPLIINVSTLLIIYFVPFADLWQEVRFFVRWHRYNEVVQLVEDGDIAVDGDGVAQLPSRLAYLSQDGRILIHRNNGTTHIFFTTRQITPWNYTGYLYTSDNMLDNHHFDGQWRSVVQKRPYWFICSSY